MGRELAFAGSVRSKADLDKAAGLPKNLNEGYSSIHGCGIRQTGGTGNCPAPRRARGAAVRLLPAWSAAGGQRRSPAGGTRTRPRSLRPHRAQAGTGSHARPPGRCAYRKKSFTLYPCSSVAGGASAVKRDVAYLSHIRDATRRIQDYTRDGQEAFMASTLIQDAVIRNLEIIGEATKALSPAFRKQHSNIPCVQHGRHARCADSWLHGRRPE